MGEKRGRPKMSAWESIILSRNDIEKLFEASKGLEMVYVRQHEITAKTVVVDAKTNELIAEL